MKWSKLKQTIESGLFALFCVLTVCVFVVGCGSQSTPEKRGSGSGYIYIDKDGHEIAGPFEWAYPFSEGLGSVKVDGKYGFVDKKGTMKIAPQYRDAAPFDEQVSCVQLQDSTYSFIDHDGKEILKKRFPDARPFRDGLAAVRTEAGRDKPWGFISRDGKLAIQPKFVIIGRFSDERCIIKKTRSDEADYGFIDKTGAVIIPCVYKHVERFNDGYAMVTTADGAVQKLDRAGKTVPLATGCKLYPLKREVRWGFVDMKGEYVVPPFYRGARPFSEGLAAVQFGDGKWGFIGESGKVEIPPQYDLVDDFAEGYAKVAYRMPEVDPSTRTNVMRCGYIDKTGREVIPAQFKRAYSFSEGLAVVER